MEVGIVGSRDGGEDVSSSPGEVARERLGGIAGCPLAEEADEILQGHHRVESRVECAAEIGVRPYAPRLLIRIPQEKQRFQISGMVVEMSPQLCE
jgi:hypothetical protein